MRDNNLKYRVMENDKITEGIKQMAEMFKNAQTERKAFIFMPDFEGFKVYEVSEESAKMALTAQALKDKAETERPNEDSGLGLQHVSFSEGRAEVREYAQWKSCKHEGCSRAVAGVDYCFEHERT